MESKKINQLATELAPELSDLTIIGDPTTGISKKITLSQMASLFTGTVEEYANLASFPLVGTADTIYIALDTNILYRWNTGTSAYVELSPNVVSSLVFNDANGFDGTISLVGSVATLTITTALTQGSVPFIGASGALTQDNTNFFWDNSNKRLGINTNTPTGALDVFGSGIIGRINGTSTNNAFLGFSSAGSNKWSIGNVQSDHRFRIYNEAATSELFTVLPTGEIGVGIANPLTKLHIDGGASALIANLDANVSVAKSVSFRSDNSSRFNIEVSGTESGSNAGMDFFLRTYTDAGALIETPFSIVRSTGVTTIKSLTLTNALSIANGGTGSTTQNFVDLTTTQSIGGAKTFTSALAGTSASFSSTATATAFIPSGSTIPTNGMYLSAANTLNFATNSTNRLSISSTGAATFSGNILTNAGTIAALNGGSIEVYNTGNTNFFDLKSTGGNFALRTNIGGTPVNALTIASTGAATFVSTIAATNASFSGTVENTGGTGFQSSVEGGFRLRNTANSGNLGGLTRRSYWAGGAALDTQIFAETGYGIYLNVDGGSTKGLFITSGGNLQITASDSVLYTRAAASGKAIYWDIRNSADSRRGYIGFGGDGSSDFQFSNNENGSQAFITNGTERMRINGGGEIGIGMTASTGNRFMVRGSDSTSGNTSIFIQNSSSTTLMYIRNDGAFFTGTASSSPYNNTSGSAANLVVTSGGSLERSTSSIKYKKDVKDYDKGLAEVLKMRPVYYKSINEREKDLQFSGLIAEEIHELGLTEFVQYAEDGTPDALAYQNMVALLTKAIQEQQAQIEELKAKIK